VISHIEYHQFKKEFHHLNRTQQLLQEVDNWQVVRESSTITIESKSLNTEFLVRAKVVINKPAFYVIGVLSEIDLLTTWIEPLETAELLAEPSLFRKFTRYVLKFPWPLSNRESYFSFSGVPLHEQNAALIIMYSVEQDHYLHHKVPPPPSQLVRMMVPVGGLYVQFVDSNTTEVSFVVETNPYIVSFT